MLGQIFHPEFKANEIHVNLVDGKMFMGYFQRTHNVMERPMDEVMEKTLSRLQKKFAKKPQKLTNSKKARETVEAQSGMPLHDENVWVIENGNKIDSSSLTNAHWRSGMIVHMHSDSFLIVLNPPRVLSLSTFPIRPLLACCPIVASITTEYCDNTEFIWCLDSADGLIILSKDPIFIPQEEHIGNTFKLFCIPFRKSFEKISGRAVVHYFNCKVQPAVIPKIIGVRHDFLNSKSISMTGGGNHLRVMTYNILADSYATSEHAIKSLYAYVDSQYLQLDYRCQLILYEISHHNCDIICLQECDSKSYDAYFFPYLQSRGYSGLYTGKTGSVPEGCAFFFKTSIFDLKLSIDFHLKTVLRDDPALETLFLVRPDLLDIVCDKLGTTSQIAVLTSVSNPKRVFIIANTHLFYHPAAAYIRLLQTHTIIRKLCEIRDHIKQTGLFGLSPPPPLTQQESNKPPDELKELNEIPVWASGNRVSLIGEIGDEAGHRNETDNSDDNRGNDDLLIDVIFAGDLNSTPETAVIEYILSGIILPEHEVWRSIDVFRWDRQLRKLAAAEKSDDKFETEIENSEPCHRDDDIPLYSSLIDIFPVLSHDLNLVSAAGFPQYTNFHSHFQDILDYIFIQASERMEVNEIAPFPNYEQLAENTALPSHVFPSDHLPVCVDLKLN